jgi:mRNA interferase YafQ
MLSDALALLAADKPLPERFRDHALVGQWKDCHLRPDLVLIYRKPDDATLRLLRLGSHSELGL